MPVVSVINVSIDEIYINNKRCPTKIKLIYSK